MFHSYWLDTPVVLGENSLPKDGGILIIGAGFSGVSAAYWLEQYGYNDITIVDLDGKRAASYRNCGHILYGTVESMQALKTIHGYEAASDIWEYSISVCEDIRSTISKLNIDCEYQKEGYLVVAIDEVEHKEVLESVRILNEMGFQSDYIDASAVKKSYGIQNSFGARYEQGSGAAHPVKFRNGLLNYLLSKKIKYHSGVEVKSLEELSKGVEVKTSYGKLLYDAVIIATNAYSPLFSDFFKKRKLIEPFKGQIIVSEPLKKNLLISIPHSFDHGYEYALKTKDNRLMIGGWRNHTPTKEMGSYDLAPNPLVEDGLKAFAQKYYDLPHNLKWDYSWSGIMASTTTGFPFIGPTESPRVFSLTGFNGHGFSWSHGSAKLLADIIDGRELDPVAKYFNPIQTNL